MKPSLFIFSSNCSLVAKKYSTRILGLRDGDVVFDGTPEELTNDAIRNIYGKDVSGIMSEGEKHD